VETLFIKHLLQLEALTGVGYDRPNVEVFTQLYFAEHPQCAFFKNQTEKDGGSGNPALKAHFC
jgi:hypothetical protein